MQTLTGKERIVRILKHEPVDRIGLFEHFWGDTHKAWVEAGKIRPDEDLNAHFNYDMTTCWPLNLVADLDFQPVVLEENAESRLSKDGNGAILRQNKMHDGTPEHVDFTVKTSADWQQWIAPILKFDRRRINFKGYREERARAAQRRQFFCWSGVNVFELMHPVCGHEHLLAGMALEPEWITEMVTTYSDLVIQLQETLFAEEGKPDGLWYYEDMGFKERPFMSPEMYRELVMPGHRKTFDYAHGLGLPVIVHSCGFVEPLIPDLIAAGMDALQVMEIKAGMDSCKIKREFGDWLALIGGIDVRCLYGNDLSTVDRELEKRVPVLMQGSGYVLHSDHSIPSNVTYETYAHFVRRGLELGTYRG
ncbi:MAG: uroporphyrinogen decarboxylase family protein [bacterium]